MMSKYKTKAKKTKKKTAKKKKAEKPKEDLSTPPKPETMPDSEDVIEEPEVSAISSADFERPAGNKPVFAVPGLLATCKNCTRVVPETTIWRCPRCGTGGCAKCGYPAGLKRCVHCGYRMTGV